ncbi:MAG: hypothetical protein JWN52_3023 [Actinomycetia bacterium]|nr:hypothetical protein [Actinomycetes bacterium]
MLWGIAIVTPVVMGVAELGDDLPGSTVAKATSSMERTHATHSVAAVVDTPVLGSDVSTAASLAAPTEATAVRTADLRLTVTAPRTARKGDSFTYTVRVANNGTATPSAVVVRIMLPQGTVRTGAHLPNGVGGEAAGRFGQLVLPPMKPGTSLTMSITVKAQTAGTLVNSTRITHVEGARDVASHPDVRTITRVR